MVDSTIKAKIVDKLANYFGVTPSDASLDQMYKAVSLTVLDILMAKKKTFMHEVRVQQKKKVPVHEVSKDIIETYYDQSIFVGIFILKEKYQNKRRCRYNVKTKTWDYYKVAD